jgi:hypothetical protein
MQYMSHSPERPRRSLLRKCRSGLHRIRALRRMNDGGHYLMPVGRGVKVCELEPGVDQIRHTVMLCDGDSMSLQTFEVASSEHGLTLLSVSSPSLAELLPFPEAELLS